MGTFLFFLILTPLLFWMYFLPSIKALERRTKMYPFVLMVNIFLGWTVLGWWLAMAWAYQPGYTKDPSDRRWE